MEIKTLKTEKKMPFKKKEFMKYEPMPMMMKRPIGNKKAPVKENPKPVKENPTKMSPGAMRRADTTTMETYKKQGAKPTSTTTSTPPLPKTKKAEGPGMMERAKAGVEKVKSGLFSLLPSVPGKLTYNEEKFEPEKKMVGKAQRGMKSYLKGSMGKGGM